MHILTDEEREELESCSRSAKTPHAHAKCVEDIYDIEEFRKSHRTKKNRAESLLLKYGPKRRKFRRLARKLKDQPLKQEDEESTHEWHGAFKIKRSKRGVVNQKRWEDRVFNGLRFQLRPAR